MSFGINDIVTLDNNKEYFLIDKNELDGITYFYAVEYTGSDEEMLDLIRLANEVEPYAVSMVDTYGLMH